MRRHDASFSSRLFALPLTLVVAACGGDSSADENAHHLEQPLASKSKPFDTGDTHPVTPAPSTKEAEAIDLRGRSRNGDYQAQMAAFSYSTSNTNSATINTADAYFNLYAGETITLGTCGVNGAWGSGDTYLRFYNPSGMQVAYSDDSCGALSSFSYTVPATGTYRLSAGCFSSTACSGTVAYSLNGALFSYNASNTNSATVNTADVYVTLSAGQIITLGTCGVNGAWGSGDTYLRFYNPSGMQVAYSDDSCGALSNFSYTIPASGTYRLSAGCFSSTACSGTVAYLIQ